MRSYPLHVGGSDTDGSGWTYVPHAEALIRDPRRAFNAKRAMELGRDVDPADVELLAARCAIGSDEDNLAALEAAAEASRALRRVPLEERKALGAALNASIRERFDEFVDVLVAEGHPRRLAEWEADGIVRASSPEALDWAFGQISQTFDDGERRMLLTRKPDGVVCINPPQNAAASNAALGLMALLAGNALVVKAPKTAPLGVMYLFREVVLPVLEERDMPPGTLNLVSGYSKRIIRAWVDSPLVDDIMFFGDSTAGLRFGQECVANGKKPILELSGNDAFLVWRDADLEAAAEALTESFYGSSQICMVPKQAVLHPAIADEFTELFLDRVAEIRPAYPSEPGAVLSPVLKMDRFFDFLGEARQDGCDVLCGGERVGVDGRPAVDGAFLEPTVVRVRGLADSRRLRCVRDETFFPLLPLIVADDAGDDDAVLLEQALDWMNDNPYGLRNSVWARDPEVTEAFATGLVNGGLLKVNDSHVGFATYLGTHGGTGLTGGPYGELHYPLFRASHLQGISFGHDVRLTAGAPGGLAEAVGG
ncbi:MAG TPA: aldehyde dehydrogenase family protein [Thermoleophilaceae bacterium]